MGTPYLDFVRKSHLTMERYQEKRWHLHPEQSTFDYKLVYVRVPGDEDFARQVARELVKENLAADVHLSFNVERVAPASLLGNEEPDNLSEGAVCLMMIKTIGKKKSALIDALKRKLEDDNVDVVVVNIELGNYDYLRPLGERITAHDEQRRH